MAAVLRSAVSSLRDEEPSWLKNKGPSMTSVQVRKFFVIAGAVLASYLLYSFYHGSPRFGYKRLDALYGPWAMIVGEVVPIAICVAAVVYVTKISESDDL